MSKDPQQIQDLLNIAALTQTFLNDDGKLPIGAYLNFWVLLPKRTTAYLTVLITKLLALQSGESSTSLLDSVRKLVDNVLLGIPEALRPIEADDKKSYLLLQNLLSTIYFVIVFYRVESDFFPFVNALTRFNSFRERIKQTQAQAQALQRGSEQMFIDELTRLLFVPNYFYTSEGLKFLVQQACLIEFPEDFDFDFDRASCHLLAPSLVNSFLRRLVVTTPQATVTSIIDTISDFFRHPSISEEMVLALMHMLRSYILLYPLSLPQQTKRAIERVKQYYIWPKPYCDYTRDILELLSAELKAPGVGFRSRFVEEIPELFSGRPHTGKERTIYLILDRECVNVCVFYELLKLLKSSPPSVVELQANLTANILTNCLGVDPTTLRLEYCSENNIREYFMTAIDIMTQALLKDEKEAETFRNAQLTTLKETILQNASNAAPIVKITHPKLASLEFVCKLVDCNPDIIKVANWTNNNRQAFLQRPTFAVLDDILNQNLQAYKSNFVNNSQSNRKPIVRIAIVGNDSSVASVVTAYIGCRLTKPEYFSSLDVRFYLVPTHTCRLANFIAKYDKWYGRHVLCLSRCLLGVYPLPQTSSTAKDEETSSQSLSDDTTMSTPAFILRTELETYFRDAHWTLDVSIFQCECFKNILEANSIIIPFCQRAEIGVAAYSLGSKDVNGNVKFIPIALSLKFLQVNPLGVPRLTRTVEPKVYEQVLLTNVPWSKDPGTVPHPTHTWLELYLRESDIRTKDSKKKDKEKAQKKDKTAAKIGRSYHVCSLEVEPQDKSRTFEILLDGIRYGPFAKIKITPVSDAATETVYSLPIMTYFPPEDSDFEL